MRMFRLISGLVALALAATLSGTAATAAAAPAAATVKAGQVDTAAKAAPAKPPHKITKNFRQKRLGPQKFAILGKVRTFPNKRVFVGKDRCASKPRTCKFKRAGGDKTNRKGQFRVVVQGTGNCFILIVPSTKRYRTTRAPIGCIR